MNDGRLSDAALGVFPEPIAIVDRDLGVQKANAAWSTTFADSPLAEPTLAAALAKVLSGETPRAEVNLDVRGAIHAVTIVPVPDGESRAALVHARPQPTPAKEPAPRSRDERIPATLLRRILDRLPVTVSLVDSEGRSVFSNETRARLLGAAAKDERESGKRALLIDPADAEFAREVEARVLATGTEEIISSDVPTALGMRSMFFHLVPVEGEGPEERLVLCVGQDVTEQLRAERDLREQQDFIRQVIDSDPNLLFVKDDCGTFLLVNKAFADVVGKPTEELVGQHVRATVFDETTLMEGYLDIDKEVFATLEERTVEERVRWHTGEDRWYQTTKRPLVRPNGEVHVLGCSVDITTRLETQRKLEEAAMEVERRAVEAFRQAEAKAALVEELDQKLGIIEAQHQEILTLSAPLLEVAEGVLAVPVVGAMTQTRAEEIMHRLLAAIVDRQVASVVLDLTGLEAIETHTADHLMSIVKAIRLLGADAVISGIRPAVAQTIVELGIDLSGFVTKRTLRSAIFSRERMRSAASNRRR